MIINYRKLVEEEQSVKESRRARAENLKAALNSILMELSESLSLPSGSVNYRNDPPREYLNVSSIDVNSQVALTYINNLKPDHAHVLIFAVSLFIHTMSGDLKLINAPVRMWFEGDELIVRADKLSTHPVRLTPDNSPGCYSDVVDLLKLALLTELKDKYL